MTLDNDGRGRISTKCQATDYELRGKDLADLNVIDFFVNSYEVEMDPKSKPTNVRDHGEADLSDLSRAPRGRPRHERVPYLPAHPKSKCKQRIVRSKHHNNLPSFIGRYFPRRDDPDVYPFSCASMLMLLKPWRNVKTDLKSPSQSWESAFETFMSAASRRIRNIITGIQYFHDCQSSAQRHSNSSSNLYYSAEVDTEPGPDDLDLAEDSTTQEDIQAPLSEEGLAQLIASQTPWREEWHGRLAVETAKITKVFPNMDDSAWTQSCEHVIPTNGNTSDSNLETPATSLDV